MKLKKLAAALALAAAGAPAFAAIDTSNNSELFAVVWDETVGSYTMDLGISLNTFLANASTAGYGFSAAVGGAFAQYTAADTNLADGTATSGTRWALFAVDSESFGDPTDTRYLTTANGAGVPPTVTNGTLNTIVPQLATFAADASQTGTHGVAVANNGNSFNPSGSLGTFVESTYFGNPALGLNAGNLIGSSSSVYFYDNTSYDLDALASRAAFAGTASFNGSTFSYTVAAIPEPGGIALMLAGMSALGFVGRRVNRD